MISPSFLFLFLSSLPPSLSLSISPSVYSLPPSLPSSQEHAFEASQKYKEGKFIIELAHMVKENGWN